LLPLEVLDGLLDELDDELLDAADAAGDELLDAAAEVPGSSA